MAIYSASTGYSLRRWQLIFSGGTFKRLALHHTGVSMLNACFTHEANLPKRRPSAKRVEGALPGLSFESRAFTALYKHADALQIKTLWRCNAARHDGYLETKDGEIILLEMKECLGWGAFQAASAEFFMGKSLLGLDARRAIIVFERVSREWNEIRPYGAWGQLALHASELAGQLQIGGLQLLPDGSGFISKAPQSGKAGLRS